MTLSKRFLLILAASCLVLSPSFSLPVSAATDNTISVVTTLALLADLTQEIGGPYVTVTSLVPGLGNPHSFEPTIRHLRLLQDADLFIRVGLDLEPWSDQLLKSADRGQLLVLTLGQAPDHDPHIWLDEPHLQAMIDQLTNTLCELMPARAAYFVGQAQAFLAQAAEIFAHYRRLLPQQPVSVVTAVPTYSYLLADLGLREIGPLEEGHGDQPSARRVAQLVSAAKAGRAVAVISEQGFDHGFGAVLAQEAGLPLVYLTPTPAPNEEYLSFIRRNLEALTAAVTGVPIK
ncbi:MAG: zinc ABC transporter substrate-binding protein [Firmicutes bacterium]|nr:zinc ABC transporter substrate-binding protein [Bacillota bacterium]